MKTWFKEEITLYDHRHKPPKKTTAPRWWFFLQCSPRVALALALFISGCIIMALINK